MAEKPIRRSGRKRGRSLRGAPKASRERRRRVQEAPRDDEEMLREFSDDTNTFYTDEHAQRKRRSGEADSKKKQPKQQKLSKQPKKTEKRKPISPTQRKIIRIISYGVIISVVLIVGVVLSLTVLFKTQSYEVSGVTKYSEDEIVSTCGIGKGDNIFLAPKSPAEKRIKDAYPYVEEAHVTFKIPDTIRISVIEAVEGYLVKVNDTTFLVISTKGRILDQISDSSQYDLPIFIGPTLTSGEVGDYVSYEDDRVVDMIESITQTFADNGYQGITEIDATDTADISFTYDDRVKVKLGIPEDLDYKIRTAMTIINENLDKNQTGTVTGILDVSRCNSTKRSYFNEQEIHPTEEKPSEKPTEAAADGGYTDDGYSSDYDNSYSDDYYDNSYEGDDYSFDNGEYYGDYGGDYEGYDGDGNYE